MPKSLFPQDGVCYVCGGRATCRHHIFEGTGRRKISDKEGMVVQLCDACHNMSDHGVHFNKKLDLELKREAQLIYEKTHTREEFIERFGRNYALEDKQSRGGA